MSASTSVVGVVNVKRRPLFFLTLAFLFFVIAISSSAYSMPAWDDENDPFLMSYDFATRKSYIYRRIFSTLPTSGKLSKLPWSDDYWPTYSGGISYRWNAGKSDPISAYGYRLLSENEINRSLDTKKLSPAEKYDL
ncbi:MAG: hypothetical protein HQK53_05345, partial [Oligoflexia bacterium]|nr:hypothetical protein [Oligoflexia bacterium]